MRRAAPKIEVKLLCVGQKVKVNPGFGKESRGDPGVRRGRIIYVHPLNRFAVVDMGVFKESFYPEQTFVKE